MAKNKSKHPFVSPVAVRHGMSILALDLGTVTGWAMRTPTGNRVSGTVSFQPRRFEGGGMRFVAFEAWLSRLEITPDVIFFEEVNRHLGIVAAHVYGGFLATLMKFCEQSDPKIPYCGVPVQHIKKHATGSGAAKKELMVARAIELYGDVQDDNEADALHLLDFVITSGMTP